MEIVESGNVEYWETRWIEHRTGWHAPTVNPFLKKYFQLMTGQNLPESPPPVGSPEFMSNSTKRWFIPLCGKSLDIPFLLDMGYQVFGVEGVRQAIQTLDTENSLNLLLDETESIYKGPDGRLKIYLGDLFKCPIERFGPFDYVWDRGSFIALEYPFRDSYKVMMQRALRKADGSCDDFRYLLETTRYDRTKYPGPPRSVSDEEIEKYYEDWTDVTFLEKEPLPNDHNLRKVPDIGPDCDALIYLLTHRQL